MLITAGYRMVCFHRLRLALFSHLLTSPNTVVFVSVLLISSDHVTVLMISTVYSRLIRYVLVPDALSDLLSCHFASLGCVARKPFRLLVLNNFCIWFASFAYVSSTTLCIYFTSVCHHTHSHVRLQHHETPIRPVLNTMSLPFVLFFHRCAPIGTIHIFLGVLDAPCSLRF